MTESQLWWTFAWAMIILAGLFWWRILKYKKERSLRPPEEELEEEDALDHYTDRGAKKDEDQLG